MDFIESKTDRVFFKFCTMISGFLLLDIICNVDLLVLNFMS